MAIDWDILDYRDEFEFLEAAFYWCGLEPNESEIPEIVEAVHQALKNYVKVEPLDLSKFVDKSTLAAMRVNFPPQPPSTHISRKELIAYANERGFKPAFLFPDARNTDVSGEDELNRTERKTLLLIIKRLLELEHIDISQREATTKVSALTGICTNTVRKYLKEIRRLQ